MTDKWLSNKSTMSWIFYVTSENAFIPGFEKFYLKHIHNAISTEVLCDAAGTDGRPTLI